MTAPIGYPEAFGTLLRREGPALGMAPKGNAEVGYAPGTVQQPARSEQDGNTLDQAKPIEGPSFADHLAGFVSGIDQTQKTAEYKAEEFAVGHHNDIHGTMIAVEQADISLHLLANVRNRVVDLYREVMRMGS
jgi:flagellar hook-basal body complex protein FliE